MVNLTLLKLRTCFYEGKCSFFKATEWKNIFIMHKINKGLMLISNLKNDNKAIRKLNKSIENLDRHLEENSDRQ